MEEYNKLLEKLNTDIIARRVINLNKNKPIDKIYELIELAYMKNTSRYWFQGDIVLLYPIIKEVKSRKEYETIYGAHIGKNMLYIYYQALLLDLFSKKKYVLEKAVRFEVGDELPMNIFDLEELERTTDVNIPILKLR